MNNNILQDFKINIEHENNFDYIVLSTKVHKKYLAYQVEMIANNDTNFLPIAVRRVDNDTNYYYDITSKTRLKDYLKSNKIDSKQLISILKNIIKIVFDCNDLILSNQSVIYNYNYVFIDKNTLKPYFIYMPIEIEIDINNTLKELFLTVLSDNTNSIFSINSNIEEILNMLNLEKFNLMRFNMFLDDLEKKNKNLEDTILIRNISENELYTVVDNKSECSKDSLGNLDNQNCFLEFKIPKQEVKEEKKSIFKKIPHMHFNKWMIIGGVTQLLLMITCIGLVATGVLDEVGDDPVTTNVVAVFIGILLSVLLWRYTIKNIKGIEFKKEDKPISKQINQFEEDEEIVIPTNDEIESLFSRKDRNETIDNNDMNKNDMKKNERKININGNISKAATNSPKSFLKKKLVEKTESKSNLHANIQIEKNTKDSYLEYTNNEKIEKIILNKDIFILGRVLDEVDYAFDQKTIGKKHAKIIKMGNLHFIQDLNSVNGTYVNEKNIKDYGLIRLNCNDVIHLSEIKLVFKEI